MKWAPAHAANLFMRYLNGPHFASESLSWPASGFPLCESGVFMALCFALPMNHIERMYNAQYAPKHHVGIDISQRCWNFDLLATTQHGMNLKSHKINKRNNIIKS